MLHSRTWRFISFCVWTNLSCLPRLDVCFIALFALAAVHWGVLDAHNALFIAASRMACILVAVVQLAVLSVLISPDIASERVRSTPSS